MRRGPWAEADDLDVKVNLTRTLWSLIKVYLMLHDQVRVDTFMSAMKFPKIKSQRNPVRSTILHVTKSEN